LRNQMDLGMFVSYLRSNLHLSDGEVVAAIENASRNQGRPHLEGLHGAPVDFMGWSREYDSLAVVFNAAGVGCLPLLEGEHGGP